MSKTFTVDRVQPSDERPEFSTARKAIEQVLGTGVESCSDPDASVICPYGFHTLMEAIHRAYDEHRPLVLRPDDIWLVISQGFAACVNQDPEKYRSAFVSHEGKKEIRIRRDSFVMGEFGNDWRGCFPEFSARIKEHIGESTHGLILADFTTTGDIERAASEVVLMDVVQAYFEYVVETRCGIPSITLEGSPEDWAKVAEKTRGLAKFGGLDWWLDRVYPVVDEFVNAANGNVNDDFWANFYKGRDQSGGIKADGNILNLIPYTKDYGKVVKNPVLAGRKIDTGDLPQALSCVPFIWDYYGTTYDYQFLAGHIGIVYNETTGAVSAQMGWAVRPAPKSAK